jgi:Holliday junction resolvase
VRRAAKVDMTQDQIVSALRAAGATVQSLAQVGKGCPDLLVARRGEMYLIECKTGKAKPNELQQKWHIEWNAPVFVVYGAEDALKAIGAVK